MTQSFIRSVTEQEMRYIGSTQIYDSGVLEITRPSPFIFNITVSSQIPLPETSTSFLVISGEPGADSDGTLYSGQFRIRRNPIGLPFVSISGNSLTSSQINLIKDSISITENSSSNGLDSLTNVTFSLTPIARAGISSFTVTIPYDDENITLPGNDIVIPFLSFDASNRDVSYSNPINVSVENNELTINAGAFEREAPVIILSSNYASGRNITTLTFNYNPITDSVITITSSENLSLPSRKEGIRFVPTNITLLPAVDSSGFSTTANYNVSVSSNLWVNRQSINLSLLPANVWRETGSVYSRLSYDIKYGIGKIESDEIVPERMFSLGVYSGTSVSMDITGRNINFTINDQGYTSTSRRAFSILNRYSSPFTRIYLYTDAVNSANNLFSISGYINTAPVTMSYSGFSNTMTVYDFIVQVESILQTQYNAWYNPRSPISGLVFTIDERYKYGNIGEMSNVDTLGTPLNPNQNLNNTFHLVPANTGIISNYSLEFYNNQINKSLSFQEIYDELRRNLGSYGFFFEWNIPNISQWRDLKFCPIVYKGTTVESTFIYQNSILIPYSFYSIVDCFFSLSSESSKGDEYNNSGLNLLDTIVFDSTSFTLASTAEEIESQFDEIILARYPTKAVGFDLSVGFPSAIGIDCLIPGSYYSNVPYTNVYKSSSASSGLVVYGNLTSTINPGGYTRYQKPITSENTTGNTLSGSFSKITLTGTNVLNTTIPISPLDSLGDLVDIINDPDEVYHNIIRAGLVDNSYSFQFQTNISPIDFWDMITQDDLYINSRVSVTEIRRYEFSRYTTLQSLINAISNDWLNNIEVLIDAAALQHSDAISSNLISGVFEDITVAPLPKLFNGVVSSIPFPSIPTSNVVLNMSILFANTTDPDPSDPPSSGVQVALGGYEKNGVFFSNKAPNAFSEPVYNSAFPISFTTIDADVIYLLLKTRRGLVSPSYTSTKADYSGMARFSNGYVPYSFAPYVPTESRFTTQWDEGGTIGVPTVIAIPAFSTSIDITIEDNSIQESINLTIINKPSELDQFGFLAVNRTNNNRSQKESKVSRTFGLVLDNRASWDILISPEAKLTLDSSGTIFHLNSLYKREMFDDDEGFDVELVTDLPSEIRNSISIIPVANSPQVWILKVDYGVKQYLGNLIAENNDKESTIGCSISLDFLITGRTTGVQGTARVIIYHDYTCVYDIGLCDHFWNLIDPPKPSGPEIIQNLINFSYRTLVDCNNLTTQIGENVAINAPILITIKDIPTFKNGNSLLLIKSSYTPEIQGFYYPTGNQIDSMQFSDCSDVNQNLPLIQRLNKEFLFLPNQENPINDVSEIRSLLLVSDSYLWVKPQFQFPPDDEIKDCDDNEIVIVGIGYAFKNWVNGSRQDDILIGVNLLFPQGIFSSPEMNICYRYYYNQKET